MCTLESERHVVYVWEKIKNIVMISDELRRSMYNVNNSGQRMELWGTPLERWASGDEDSRSTT